MYRTVALAKIDVTGAGLVIEDFNMTFEIHAKKLGRIEFHPSAAVAYTQDPDNFGEYVRQVRRWILGFWQTVRRHRLHPSVFWVALAVFIFELLTSSLMFVLVSRCCLPRCSPACCRSSLPIRRAGRSGLADLLQPQDVLIGVLMPDYLLTIMAACVLRNPRYLYLGLVLPAHADRGRALCLRVLPKAWMGRSSGVWVSPTRRRESRSTASRRQLDRSCGQWCHQRCRRECTPGAGPGQPTRVTTHCSRAKESQRMPYSAW